MQFSDLQMRNVHSGPAYFLTRWAALAGEVVKKLGVLTFDWLGSGLAYCDQESSARKMLGIGTSTFSHDVCNANVPHYG